MNSEQAKNSSKAFYLAFLRCLEQRSLPDGQVQFLAIPAIVCAAFSIELGLKFLVLQSGNEASGHKLKVLFDKLELPAQQLIVTKVGLPRQEFDANLETASNTFVEWRYVYEQDSANATLSFF